MSVPFPEPTIPVPTRADVFLGYLDYFRSRLVSKLEALPEGELRSSLLPSRDADRVAQAPHLRGVALARVGVRGPRSPVPGPTAGTASGTSPEETLAELVAALQTQAERTRAIVEIHDLADVGQPSALWQGADPPALERILFHLLQEYARHVGHMDIVCELATDQSEE